jgi:hypothetical protein
MLSASVSAKAENPATPAVHNALRFDIVGKEHPLQDRGKGTRVGHMDHAGTPAAHPGAC